MRVNEKVRCVVKKVGEPARIRVIKNTLDEITGIIGAFPEVYKSKELYGGNRYVFFFDGDHHDDSKKNIPLGEGFAYGTVVMLLSNRRGESMNIVEDIKTIRNIVPNLAWEEEKNAGEETDPLFCYY